MSNSAAKNEYLLTDPIDFDLNIDHTDIQGELSDQSLLFAKWVKLANEATLQEETALALYEEEEARVRLEASVKGAKVQQAADMAKINPKVKELRREWLESKRLKEQYKGFVKALTMKHESLKDICANIRKELI